jgi:phosphatidylglycerol---prolipoprotein diacylglyceryl transferase
MIPYWQPGPILGFIQPFGLLVVCAILTGTYLMRRRAEQLGLERRDAVDLATWLAVAGFIAAHLFDVVAYRWPEMVQDPLLLVDPRRFSISSFGGFGGAVVGMFLWKWRRGLPLWPFADAAAFGLVPAWTFGRLGCFLAHDHPGRHSTFFLAVRYPGGSRFDLGLYEAMWAFLLGLVFLALARRPRRIGTYLAVACLAYAPVRFLLDFLRATDVKGADPRFLGLTPGQYASIAVLALGVLVAWLTWGRPAAVAAAPAAPAPDAPAPPPVA